MSDSEAALFGLGVIPFRGCAVLVAEVVMSKQLEIMILLFFEGNCSAMRCYGVL
jgi:hypothetical protein